MGARGAWSADHVAHGASDEGKDGSENEEKPFSDDRGARQQRSHKQELSEQHGHPYVVSRLTNRGARLAGLQKVGMISAALSTIGLSLLQRRGREGAGAVLLASAVGLSLLKRED